MAYKIYVDLSVSEQYNNDADEDGGPYSYQGSYTAWLDNVTAHVIRDKGARFTYAETFDVPFEPVAGTAVFVVTVKHNEGDTFSNGERYIPVAVLDDAIKAYQLKDLIETDYSQKRKVYNSIEFEEYSISTSHWKGYFESLIAVDIHTVLLEA